MKQREKPRNGITVLSDRDFERHENESADEYRERLFEDHKKAVEETRQKEWNR